MTDILRDAVTESPIFRADHHVLVACSGGVDSVALAHVLSRYGDLGQLSLCYVDHALHEDCDEQWGVVESLGALLGCAVYREFVDVSRLHLGNGPEDGARQERYRCLEAVRSRIGADAIALAHHADDQVETFLIRMSQGSGMHGLRGMASENDRLRRPLLKVYKSELEAYVTANELSVAPDPTNASNVYLRNAIRNQLRPIMDSTLGAHWSRHVLNLMNDFSQRAVLDGHLAQQLLASACQFVPNGVVVRRSAFSPLLEHEKYLLARACLASLSDDALVRRDHIVRLLEEVELNSSTHRIQLSESLWMFGEYECVYLGRNEQIVAPPVHITGPGRYTWGEWHIGVDEEIDGGERLSIPTPLKSSTLILRSFDEGESLTSASGTKKISRLLIDAKLPRRLRTQVLVVESGGDVFWCWMPKKQRFTEAANGSKTTVWILPPEEFRRRT